ITAPDEIIPVVAPSTPGKAPKYSSKLRFSLMMKTTCLIWVMSGVPVASSIDLESWAMAVENKENRYARSNDRRIWVRLITLTCSSSLASCNRVEPTSYVLRERPARNGDKTLDLRGSTEITSLKGHDPSE